MKLTIDQEKALDAIGRWLKDEDQWLFYLGGYAGTGKTTLMHYFINSLPEPPVCLAPTGKAASVLQKRLEKAAVTTIHSALYNPVIPDISKLESLLNQLDNSRSVMKDRMLSGEGDINTKPHTDLLKAIAAEKERLANIKLKFQNKPCIEIQEGDLVIVDESSMVTDRMLDDLSKLNAKILFVGDPGQLPPVGDKGYFTYTRPDAMLSQVMRQALDNPILALSMKIRNGEKIDKKLQNETVERLPKAEYDVQRLTEFDQVLTGTNAMRRKVNRIIRKTRGHEGVMPQNGERLICLKNQYKFGMWLINGIQCVTTDEATTNDNLDWVVSVLYEGELLDRLPYYAYPFRANYDFKAEQDPWPMRKHLAELDYGYAITVHKSQGSEWDNVCVVDDEMFIQDKEFRKRWLYTAVTRAKQKLVWLTR
jgi:exodeoxyribonuclease-5